MHVDGSTFDEGDFPVENFSDEGLITGFIEGLLVMREGSKIELVIPGELGYGKAGQSDWWSGTYLIYPNEVLIFELSVSDLVKGGDQTAAEEAPAEEEAQEDIITQEVEF